MEHLSVWVGAGVVTAGVSAALLAGAGIAGAETGSDSGSGSTSSDAGKPDSAAGPKDHEPKTGPKSPSKPDSETKPDTKGDASGAGDPAPASVDKDEKKADERQPATESPTERESPQPGPRASKRDVAATGTPGKKPAPEATEKTEPPKTEPPKTEPTEKTEPLKAEPTEAVDTAQPAAESVAVEPVEPARTHVAAAAVAPKSAPATAPAVPSALDAIASLIGSVVVNVGSLAFNALQAVEALVTGPPVLPPNSTVTVRSSTIQLSNGQRVAANWFYPEGDKPPTDMILLQHGFLALGPMYSYTAANLAEQTHSIVVTPTLTSNVFAGDSFWLGGTGMAASIAELFAGKRAALTASALDAGYAARYGLDPATAQLPQTFALAGHSLGANLVSGAAGFLAANGDADDLVGVILLDGVPIGDTLPDALAKLDAYETRGGHYVPIREIGAPWNLFNSLSNVNDALSAARPDRFNGVVLAGGVHMDSMLGGNPLIQFAAYLVAGFPQPQNPPAVDALTTTWLNEWFGGHTDVGDDLVPGTTIDIPTPRGTAHGVVIGNPPAGKLLRGPVAVQPSAPSILPRTNPRLARLAA